MRLRITLVVTLMVSIGMLGLTCFVLRPHLDALKRERSALITQRDQQSLAAEKARRELEEVLTTITGLQAEVASVRKRLEAENRVLEQKHLQSVAQLAEVRAELLARSRRIAEWDVLGLTPGQVLAVITTNQTLQLAITNLTQHNEKLSRDYAELKRKVEDTDDAVPEMPPVAGRILALDQKWNFVVLNIGEDQGLKQNGVLLVARDTELLGKLRITRVEADRSIADFLPGSDIAAIREGDHVFN